MTGSVCAPACAVEGFAGEFDGGVVTPTDGEVDGGADAGVVSTFTGVCASTDSCIDITGGLVFGGSCLANCTVGGTTCPSTQMCQMTGTTGTAGVCAPN